MKNTTKYQAGQKIPFAESHIKIMAIADGYIMARRKGCIPFCESEKEFSERIIKEGTK